MLRAAITLADASGIESLTMRRLGHELGVEAMSLYNHVSGKDDILEGIVDAVLDEIELPSSSRGWKAAIRQSAISAHEALQRHPWVYSLMMSTKISPARLRWMESTLRTLREAGFSAATTCHAFHALDSHISGFMLWQASMPATGEDLRQIAADFLRELPKEEYPYSAEHIEQHITDRNDDHQTEFEFGLDLILDGLERMLHDS